MATRNRRRSSFQVKGRDLQSIIQCIICMDLPETPKLLPCGHMFCLECLEHMHLQEAGQRTYSVTRIRCPTCRKMSDVPFGGLRNLGTDYRVVHLMEALDQAQRRRSSSRTDSEDLDPIAEEPHREPISDAEFYNWETKPTANEPTESELIPHEDNTYEPPLENQFGAHSIETAQPAQEYQSMASEGNIVEREPGAAMRIASNSSQEAADTQEISVNQEDESPEVASMEDNSILDMPAEQTDDSNEPQSIPTRDSLTDDNAFAESQSDNLELPEESIGGRPSFMRQRSVDQGVNYEIICGLAFFVHEQLRERQCNALTVFLLEMLKDDRKRLLEQWVDQKTALFYAIELSLSRDFIDLFLNECAVDVEQYSMYDDGIHDKKVFVTALIGAAAMNNMHVARALVSFGANINHATADIGLTALKAACKRAPSNMHLIKYLLDNGADVNMTSSDKRTCLMESVDSDPSGDICTVLMNYGAKINEQDSKGLSALHEAARKDRYPIVNMLLDHNADANLRDRLGLTAFHLAVATGCIETTQSFLDHEVDVNQLTSNGDTALHLATKNGNIDIVKLLLKKEPLVDIQNDDGHTALIDAVMAGLKEAVYELLKHGADSSLRENKGLSAFNLTNNLDVLSVLREHRSSQFRRRPFSTRGDIRTALNRMSHYYN